MAPLLRLLRPHQYTKNLLVLAAPGAAGRLDEAAIAGRSTAAFALFCAVSSAGYVINDLLDVDADRLHPIKKERPLANGSVPTSTARATAAVLAIGALALSPLLGWGFTAALSGYAAITALYSIRLKRLPWLELAAVSGGFLIRAVGGGAATNTALSPWFLVVVSSGALLLITGKRLGELVVLGPSSGSRSVLKGYSIARLRQLASVAAVVAVGGYVTWAAARATERAVDEAGSLLLRVTAVPFAIGIGRYLVLSWRGAGETPETLIVRDRVVLVAGLSWATIYAAGLYA